MKKKLIALMLAAVLGVTGIAATAQAAAGTEAASACEHNLKDGIVLNPKVYCYNYKWHVRTYEVHYVCSKCGNGVVVEESEYEEHDYDLIFLDDGTMISRCNGCGDIY